jgi:hypothetical protein
VVYISPGYIIAIVFWIGVAVFWCGRGLGSPFSGVAGGWGGVVCVLERDMMIASCHGGIREGGLQRRWIALALDK